MIHNKKHSIFKTLKIHNNHIVRSLEHFFKAERVRGCNIISIYTAAAARVANAKKEKKKIANPPAEEVASITCYPEASGAYI